MDSNGAVVTETESPQSGDEFRMDDLLSLKTVIVNKENMTNIEEKLQNTITHCRELLSNDRTDLLENFPYMFVHPPLVIFVFILLLHLRSGSSISFLQYSSNKF